MLSKDSKTIFLLTSWLPKLDKENPLKPLSARQWSIVTKKIVESDFNKPGDLNNLTSDELNQQLDLKPELANRVFNLLKRSGQAVFELEKYRNQGYDLLTRIDDLYPKRLKKELKEEAPPYFWYLGNLGILKSKLLSIQLSGKQGKESIDFINNGMNKIKHNGYSMVLSFNDDYSSMIAEEAINKDIAVIGVLPFGLLKLSKQSRIRSMLKSDKLLLLSQSYPTFSKYYKHTGKLQKMVEISLADIIFFSVTGNISDILNDALDLTFIKRKKLFVGKNDKMKSKTMSRLGESHFITEFSELFNNKKDNGNLGANNIIYTIGHSNHSIEKFIDLLQQHKIETVIELRSVPKSKYSDHFNKPNLNYELSRNGIEYIDLGKYLGGRPNDKSVLNIENKIEEDLIEKKDWYIDSIKRLIELSKQSKIVIMCSEENPAMCHRGYIITHTLLKKNIQVFHIRKDGRKQKANRIPRQTELKLM